MNFKKYVEASDTWVDSHYIMGTSTDTITTLPAVLYPNDTTATVGLKGNMSQSGTPTPQNPIQPSETGDETANLSSTSTFNNTVTDTRSVFRCNLRLLKNNEAIVNKNIDISQTGLFYITATAEEVTDDIDRIIVRHSGQTNNFGILSVNVNISSGTAVTFSANALGINPTVVDGVSLDQIMLNTGAYTPYQPYGYKIPISSASTTTPVYLGEVETTRKIYKYEFTGQEEWARPSSNIFRVGISGYLRQSDYTPICTHYKGQSAVSATSELGDYSCAFLVSSSGNNYFYIRDLNYDAYADFKSYLAQQYAAGTPVTVWYVLATETTGIVNEPIRKIGDYADTVSGITIPTIAGANALDVLTTLKPSEVTVNYKGWHPVSSVHERDNGAWT